MHINQNKYARIKTIQETVCCQNQPQSNHIAVTLVTDRRQYTQEEKQYIRTAHMKTFTPWTGTGRLYSPLFLLLVYVNRQCHPSCMPHRYLSHNYINCLCSLVSFTPFHPFEKLHLLFTKLKYRPLSQNGRLSQNVITFRTYCVHKTFHLISEEKQTFKSYNSLNNATS